MLLGRLSCSQVSRISGVSEYIFALKLFFLVGETNPAFHRTSEVFKCFMNQEETENKKNLQVLCGTKLMLFLTLAVYFFLLSSAPSKVPAVRLQLQNLL